MAVLRTCPHSFILFRTHPPFPTSTSTPHVHRIRCAVRGSDTAAQCVAPGVIRLAARRDAAAMAVAREARTRALSSLTRSLSFPPLHSTMPDEKRPNILVIWGDDIGSYILEVERERMEREGARGAAAARCAYQRPGHPSTRPHAPPSFLVLPPPSSPRPFSRTGPFTSLDTRSRARARAHAPTALTSLAPLSCTCRHLQRLRLLGGADGVPDPGDRPPG